MKIKLFIVIMFLNLLHLKAQNYVLSFTGSGASTTIDSLQVQNLTMCNRLTLLGSDQLNLIPNAGISAITSDMSEFNIYPNPGHQLCNINFNNTKAGEVNICVYDASGKEILIKSNVLSKGIHSYTLSGFKAGVNFVHIKTPENIYCQQFICLSDRQTEAEIIYQGSTNIETKRLSRKNIVQMTYNNGERLFLKAYSGSYCRFITLIPTSSQTVNFEFVACNDGDGNRYGVVTIGTQTWMGENLKTTKYNDGSNIPIVTNNSAWASLTTPAYCWYDNDFATNGSVYGALYNWHALDSISNGNKNICPTGWHVPDSSEWATLVTNLGGENLAGGKLKDYCSNQWYIPNTAATNETGFTALPGGVRNYSGYFYDITNYGQWWTYTESSITYAWFRLMSSSSGNVILNSTEKVNGFSIRCLKY